MIDANILIQFLCNNNDIKNELMPTWYMQYIISYFI
jgi:hypothetical protein